MKTCWKSINYTKTNWTSCCMFIYTI